MGKSGKRKHRECFCEILPLALTPFGAALSRAGYLARLDREIHGSLAVYFLESGGARTDRPRGDRLQRGDSVSKPRLYLNRSSHSKIRRRAQRFSMAFGTKLAASTHSGSLLPSALRSEQWEFSPQGPRPSSVG